MGIGLCISETIVFLGLVVTVSVKLLQRENKNKRKKENKKKRENRRRIHELSLMQELPGNPVFRDGTFQIAPGHYQSLKLA